MIEIKFPFSISNGSISSTSNPAEIITSRVTFCMGSQVGERIMHPSWGIDLMNAAMAMGAEIPEIMTEAIGDMFSTWFPTYVLKEVKVDKDLIDPTRVRVSVRFGSSQTGIDESVQMGVPMPDGSETFDDERSY